MSHPFSDKDTPRRPGPASLGPRGNPDGPRFSLQRRILASGETERLTFKEVEEEAEEKEAGKEALAPPAREPMRRMDLLARLPLHLQERVPSSFRSMFVWPHPAEVWKRATGAGSPWERGVGSLKDLRKGASAGMSRLWGGMKDSTHRTRASLGIWGFKLLEKTTGSLQRWRQSVPRLGGLSGKLPGTQRIARWLEDSRGRLSRAMDQKVLEQARQQMIERGVDHASALQSDAMGEAFVASLCQQPSLAAAMQQQPNARPASLSPHAEEWPRLFASKQLIPQRFPALLDERLDLSLRTIGYLLTSQGAQKRGRSVEQASVLFANMVALSLQDPAAVKALIEGVRVKWKLFQEQNANRLTQAGLHALGQGQIAKDTYHAIQVACRAFIPTRPDKNS